MTGPALYPLLGILAGAVLGGGVFLLIVAIRGAPARPPGARARKLEHALRDVAGVRGAVALVLGALTLLATRWIVAGVGVALLALGWRSLGGAAGERRAIARLEGLASWTESLRDTIAGAVGLEQAIPSSQRAAAPSLQEPLARLVDRLHTRMPMPDALRRFADDLDDPGADLIIAALIINSRLRGPGLRDLLGGLSTSVREELDMRRKINADRRSTRRSVQIVVLVAVSVALLLGVFNHSYVSIYDQPLGQFVLWWWPASTRRASSGCASSPASTHRNGCWPSRSSPAPASPRRRPSPPGGETAHDRRDHRRRGRRRRDLPADRRAAATPGQPRAAAGRLRRAPGDRHPGAAVLQREGERARPAAGHRAGRVLPRARLGVPRPAQRSGPGREVLRELPRHQRAAGRVRPADRAHCAGPADVVGIHVSFVLPIWGGLVLAIVFSVFPYLEVKQKAAQRRKDFRHAVGAFLDLVGMNLAGGRGVPEALMAASEIGGGWSMWRLRDALANARITGQTPWQALGALGEEIRLDELRDLAAALSLVAEDGAKVRESLTARAVSLRRRELADLEGQAGERSQSMLVAQMFLVAGFLVFLVFPVVGVLLGAGGH